MDKQKTKPLGHTMLKTKVAASAALLALAVAPTVANAAPEKAPANSEGVYVTILSPTPGSSYDGTKQVEVSAFYQASMNDGGVTTLELYIDGREAAKKSLDSPEARGVVSFLIDPTILSSGKHHIVVRAAAADAEVNSAATELSVTNDNDSLGNAGGDIQSTPPQLFIASPAPDATVAGTVKIKVNAHDDSGKPPYVSLFIDHAFKTLRNYPPFTFDWDTTRVANGYHTIEVYGYNDAQQVGHAEPMRVLVNNPGGNTIVRHDLSDTVKTPAKKMASAPAKAKPMARAAAHEAKPIASAPAHKAKLAAAPAVHPAKVSPVVLPALHPAKPVAVAASALNKPAPVAAAHPAKPVVAASGKKALPPTPSHPLLAKGAANGQKAVAGVAKPARPVAKAVKPLAVPAGPLLAEAQPAYTGPAITPNAPLLDDNQIAQLAPDTEGQLSPVTPAVHAATKAAVSTAQPARAAQAAKSAAPNGSPVLAGTGAAAPAPSASALALPQNLASADTGSAPVDTETLLSAPFIHPVPMSPVEAPRAPVTPSTAPETDAHSHGQPALAGSARTQSAGAPVEMASASLNPGSLSPGELFDGSPTLENPTLNQKDLALPTHRVVSSPVGGAASHHLIPLLAGEPTDPQVLARARGAYRMVFDAQPLSLDRPVQVRDSILFAPFRQIFESQGGTLLWLPEEKKIQAVSPTREIELTIGSKDALINNQGLVLAEAPYLLYGRTMVPLSFLPVALDVSVSFDAATGHLIINSNK